MGGAVDRHVGRWLAAPDALAPQFLGQTPRALVLRLLLAVRGVAVALVLGRQRSPALLRGLGRSRLGLPLDARRTSYAVPLRQHTTVAGNAPAGGSQPGVSSGLLRGGPGHGHSDERGDQGVRTVNANAKSAR